jgi:pyruvate,water dikinase
MDKQNAFIIWFDDINLSDVPLVGGKNASLGEMTAHLRAHGISVPDGFAITAGAYRAFLKKSGLDKKIEEELAGLNTKNIKDLSKRGAKIRKMITGAPFPPELIETITTAYESMGRLAGKNPAVAVRSSATAEDLPGASFAGQQETYLNVHGLEALLLATKKCMASLFTDRAISYRVDKGFNHEAVALSVAVQRMVRSDIGSSGVMFTIDTETGFDKVVVINASYGLGEMVVQGAVTPDEYLVFKPLLEKGFNSIIGKDLGSKEIKMIYGGQGGKKIKTSTKEQQSFVLTDAEIISLARAGLVIEDYFSQKYRHYQPMDIEWAKDGKTGRLYIVQARPETVHAVANKNVYHEYRLKKSGDKIVTGAAIGTKIVAGKAKVALSPKAAADFKPGDILITDITDPDWEPIMKTAAGIITNRGGRTSHAAIVARELGIPAVVGAEKATTLIKTGTEITIDNSNGTNGVVYKGKLPFEEITYELGRLPTTKTKIMANIGSPADAFKNHWLPVDGVGLGRLEFIITSHIGIHPKALLEFPKLKKQKDQATKKLVQEIERRTPGYQNKADFYVAELAEGIAKIAAAFWPNEVIIRFSDFKTNEYRTLLGGEAYEPKEENPMLGWRGASRYYHPEFKEAFKLECEALKRARETFGLTNIVPMIPFVRTPEEAKNVLAVMTGAGLTRGEKDLKVYFMCEIPSNIILADKFLDLCDGFSIGSNDLTQLVLGLDRDSGIVNAVANEKNEAVKILIAAIIEQAQERGKYIGICGQAPSDFPDFAQFLVKAGISSISLNPDTIIKTKEAIAAAERA